MSGEPGFHPGHNPWAIALMVTLATFTEVLDTSIANVALPHIAGTLSATNTESTWILTSYLVSNAIILPISGWLSTRIVSGMLNLAPTSAAASASRFFATYVARQSQRHQAFLVAHASPLEHPFRSAVRSIAGALVAAGKSSADSIHIAQARVYAQLGRQAVALAYVDFLVWMTIATACIAPLAFLLRANVPGRARAAH